MSQSAAIMALADFSDLSVVSSVFSYLKREPKYDCEKPYSYDAGPLAEEYENLRTNLVFEDGPAVCIRDLRGRRSFSISTCTAFSFSQDEISTKYLEEMTSFVKVKLQADLVIAYDYRVSTVLELEVIKLNYNQL
jgi:hypothetical protein